MKLLIVSKILVDVPGGVGATDYFARRVDASVRRGLQDAMGGLVATIEGHDAVEYRRPSQEEAVEYSERRRHLAGDTRYGSTDLSACGYKANRAHVTEDVNRITCKVCLKTLNAAIALGPLAQPVADAAIEIARRRQPRPTDGLRYPYGFGSEDDR